jgi:hypothetical protein
MKDCKNVENNLPLYLDDLLSGADKKAVEEHLKSCSQCRKTLAQLSKTQALVSNLADVEPPAWFKQKIMARVREEAEKKSFVQKWFYPLKIKIPAQIFATIFIAVLAVFIYRAGEQQMKEVATTSVPAPVTEVQKNQLPEQKLKSSVDEATQKGETIKEEAIQRKEMPNEVVRERAVYQAKDSDEEIAHDIKIDKYPSAPAAKSFEQSEVKLQKKGETKSSATGAAMKDHNVLEAQITMIKSKILLRVADLDNSTQEIQKLLIKYEATKIYSQTAQGKVFLTAEMKNQKMKDFTAKLKTIGRVEEVTLPPDNVDGNISLVIEISNY